MVRAQISRKLTPSAFIFNILDKVLALVRFPLPTPSNCCAGTTCSHHSPKLILVSLVS